MRRCAAPMALVVVCATVALGCGEAPNDLFVVTRTGTVPGARLRLLVSDGGTAACNGHTVTMTARELLDARALQRDLELPASRATVLAPGPQPVLSYAVRTPGGNLRFSDDSAGQPVAFQHLAAFVREVAKGPCGLER